MIRAILFAALALASACNKSDTAAAAPAPKPAPIVATVGADGLRHIAVEASNEGYKPDKIPGKPGEKLVLTFTRTGDSSCISQVKAPDGKLVDLPLNKPVDVAVNLPQTGEVTFVCGMGMFHGTVIAQP